MRAEGGDGGALCYADYDEATPHPNPNPNPNPKPNPNPNPNPNANPTSNPNQATRLEAEASLYIGSAAARRECALSDPLGEQARLTRVRQLR